MNLERDDPPSLQNQRRSADEPCMPRWIGFALLCAVLLGALPLVGDQPASATATDQATHHVGHAARAPRAHGRRSKRVRHRGREHSVLARSQSRGQRLRFGVYPWAAAGAVGQVNPQVPDDPYKALSAVKHLQGARPMTVHIYGQYTGADPGEADRLISDARWWSDHDMLVEMVLRFRPARSDLASGYVPWVETVTARLAAIHGVAAIQIGNEANNTVSAAAGDGAYPGAVQAIAAGVPAARQSVIAAGRPDIRIGVNWAPGTSPCQPDPLFSALQRAGGEALAQATGWVGLDVYPGTWSAPSPSVYPSTARVRAGIVSGLACLRRVQMPYAGLSSATTITVAETGWPTAVDRSELTQAAVLRAIVGAVQSVSGLYGVTDLRWFDLRDANTASGQLENGYGLLHDDYSPKPAFGAYRELIAADGGTPSSRGGPGRDTGRREAGGHLQNGLGPLLGGARSRVTCKTGHLVRVR
jgi:hypothetical protein